MRKFVLVSASFTALVFATGLGLADVVIAPEVDTWVMEQPEGTVTIEGDVVVGEALPGTVEFIEVPDHTDYGFVVVNKKRVLVDRGSRKVIKVY